MLIALLFTALGLPMAAVIIVITLYAYDRSVESVWGIDSFLLVAAFSVCEV